MKATNRLPRMDYDAACSSNRPPLSSPLTFTEIAANTVRGSLLPVLVGLLVALSPVLSARAAGEHDKRHAIVTLSDGTQYEGTVQLMSDNAFTLTALDSDADTVQSVTLKDANRPVRTFDLSVVKDMTFSSLSEEYLQKFKMLNVSLQVRGVVYGGQLGGDETKVEKVRYGAPYPVIKPKCTVVFNSGEAMTGVLNTRVLYVTSVDPDTGLAQETRKIVIRSKYSGEPGQSYDDLVRVERIRMLDEGEPFVRSMPIEFRSFDLATAGADSIRALTQDTLTKVPVSRDADGRIRVHSTLGENVFLAAQVNGMWVAGWPAEGAVQDDLFKSVETEFLKIQDYYNERKLLGIISKQNGRDIYALVRLRRDIPDPEFALAWAKATAWGPGRPNFEMGPDGELLEFYRLAIWRFARDTDTGKMALTDRGTFSRTRIKLETQTPEMGISSDLWPVIMKDGTLVVSGNETR